MSVGAVGGRFGESMAREAHDKYLATSVVTQGPLQTLTLGELRLDELPLTIYPKPARAQAWVRFGDQATRVACRILRTTQDAAGIEFTIDDVKYRCWVWGPAVRLASDDDDVAAAGAGTRV